MAYSRLAGMNSFRDFIPSSNSAFQPWHSPENDINILLLGETGVGKTTFINALINALFYNTLDEALQNELKILIPSSFVVNNTVGDTYEEVKIAFGPHNDNEDTEKAGNSATQACRSYVFRIGNRRLRLIDGPGVGDIRSTAYDATNFARILAYISQYEHLNGICILLKPAMTRLSVFFRYCVKELLRHLHVNAKDNIMFVFTNSRSTFYMPGETAPILKVLLQEINRTNNVNVPFDHENTFSFDNESFRFLAAAKQGAQFLMGEKKCYSDSWNKSAEEFVRLVSRILRCDLHAVRDTMSLNQAHQLIQILARPMAEISRLIQENISLAKNYKDEIIKSQTDRITSGIPQKVGKFTTIKERLTVCTSKRCTTIVNVQGEPTINYNTHCHAGCSLRTVVQECIGHPVIRRCRALKKTEFCRHCGCGWTKHMHITYRFETSITRLPTANAQSRVTPKSILIMIDQRISDLRREEREIQRIAVRLSKFLKENSIAPINDEMIEYLRLFVNEEKEKHAMNSNNKETIEGLERLIKQYEYEIKLYTTSLLQARTETSNEINTETKGIERIFQRIQELYSLPINGKSIREQVQGIQLNQQQDVANHEQFIDLPNEGSSSRVLITLRTLVNQRRT